MEMKRTSFVCFGAQGSKDSLVYQEIPGRDGGEEFFLFFSPGDANQEPLLRNLFREAVSASRLGAPAHYFSQFIEHVKTLTEGVEAADTILSGALLMIQIRRGDEVHLLCNRDPVLIHWDTEHGQASPTETIGGFDEVPLSKARDQRDLFARTSEDLFVLYRFTMAKGHHTVILVPSRDFIEQHRESLRNSILFPSFEFPQETGIELAVARSFPALHWIGEEKEMQAASNERKARHGRRVPIPVMAGMLAAAIALFIFFGPLAKRAAHRGGKESSALFSASDKVNRDSVRSKNAPTIAAERSRRQRPALSEAWKHTFTAPVTSSPKVYEGMIYFGCRDGFLYAFTPEGGLAWKYRSGAGIGASPSCGSERVICANYRGDLFCLDAKTGAAVWSVPTRSKIVSAPAVSEEMVVAGTTDGRLIAVRFTDAKRLWEKKLGRSIWANPVLGKEYVIAATTDGSIVRLDHDGKIIWTVKCGSGIYSSPVCLENRDLIVFGAKDKYIYAYSLSGGKRVWRYAADADVSGTPRCGGQGIFVGTKSGRLFALGFDGKLLWQRNVGGAVFSRPLLVGDTLMVTTQTSRLIAMEANSGAILGEFRAASSIYSSPDHDGERIYFGSYGGVLYAIWLSARAAT
jgi:outer membrane protein assembly factor BamB